MRTTNRSRLTHHAVPSEPATRSIAPEVHERLYRDVAALVAFDRRTGGAGERLSASYIGERLRDIGAHEVAVSTFRTQPSWVPAHFAHIAAGFVAAALPGPLARVGSALIAGSYELDVSGRSQWLRRLLPAGRGTSVSACIPAAGTARRTLVLIAHHDAAHTGLLWAPAATAASRYLSKRTGRAIPSHAPTLAALAAAAAPSRLSRGLGVGVLAASAALMVQSMRSPTTPGANDNASGVAVVLELAHRLAANPLPNTTVLLVFPGGEEVGNTGIRAWLKQTRKHLDPHATLVFNLDAVGSRGHLAVARHESLTGRIAAGCVDRAVDTATELGIRIQPVAIPNATDAVTATQAGLPTISLLSVQDGWISHLHRTSDTIDNVDWCTVGEAVTLTERIGAAWSGQGSVDD